MTAQSVAAMHDSPIDLERRVPAHGGLNGRLLAIEIRRALRNKRTLIFTTLMPLAFYFIFGRGHGDVGKGNYEAYAAISFALYGALAAATGTGAGVSVERAQGWSRQLRLTPLTGSAYIGVKVITAMVLSLIPVAVITVAALLSGASMPALDWPLAIVLSWIGGGVFASLGLFVGYLVPSENAMQIIGPVLSLLAFAGGLFYPYSLMSGTTRTIAQFTPMWGFGQIARWPLTGGAFEPLWVVSGALWISAFVLGAVILFRRDTARV